RTRPVGQAHAVPGQHGAPRTLQTSAPTAAQRSGLAKTCALVTAAAMLAAFAQVGVSGTAGSVTDAFVGSVVVPFTSAAGGVWPALSMLASATAAWASM